MTLNFSSKDQESPKIKESQIPGLFQFSSQAILLLDEADEAIKQLIKKFDKFSNKNIGFQNHAQKINSDPSTQKIENQQNLQLRDTSSQTINQWESNGRLGIGQLTKKKQKLMKSLFEVEKNLLQQKLKPNQAFGQLQQIKSPRNQKQNISSVLQRNQYKINSPIHNSNQPSNSSRTLQLMDQLNRQKIKRHQDMVERMKRRQEQEIRKIQQLEERIIKIQVKKSLKNSHKQPSQPLTQKRTKPVKSLLF